MGTQLVRTLCAAMGLVAAIAVPVRSETLAEWRFSAASGLQGWAANAELTDVRVDDEGLHARAIGGDPIVEYAPTLDIPATPWQAVEVRIRASADGMCELFWTNTTAPPHGGFRGGLSTFFRVRGGSEWQTIRVLPFWQQLGVLKRLRLDLFGGAAFDIASVRVVSFAPPTHRAEDATLAPGAVTPAHSAAVTRPGGAVAVRRTAADGFVLLAAPNAPADERTLIAVRLAARGSPQCSLLYSTDASTGLQTRTFAVDPDGKPHTYFVDMLGAPGWAGRILALGLRPGSGADTRVTVHGIRLASTPDGPAALRIDWMGVEETLPRAGQPVTVLLRVTNRGGAVARGVRARLTPGPGLRVTRQPASATASLAYGEEAEWRWTVVGAAPGRRTWTTSLTGAGAAPVREAGAVNLRPSRKLTALPPPAPVKGKLDVGVYYFPGWRGAGQWNPIRRFPERRPALGWYREGEVPVADWHLRWAAEHGITFFAYDWYWVKGARQLEHALHQAYFNSPYRSLVKFCLLWANHNPPGTHSLDDCLSVTRYWIDNYLQRPEHYRIEGRPVVIIFTPHQLRADMDSDGVRDAFAQMRALCRESGVPPLYLIACVGGDISEPASAAKEGYDAITCYNWANLGMEGEERWAPFSGLARGYAQMWRRLAEVSPLPIMTPVSGGWDSRPWHGETALVRSERTPRGFRDHLADARAFVEANPAKTLPVALIEAWNEWGEGSYIEPHQQFGFGYLDAIREVFAPGAGPHEDLLPIDVGRRIPQVELGEVGKPSWRFGQATLGWDAGMAITQPEAAGGALRATSTSNDPAFFSPALQVRASSYRTFALRLRLTPRDGVPFQDIGQLFWSTRAAPISEASSVRFPVAGDGQWHTVRISLAGNMRWRGIVTSLRLDPCNRADVDIAVQSLELTP